MNKIIAILFLFIAAQSCAQIDPYQIIKDSLGAHRILLTDSTGEYTRVLLRDAISDSIGVGKFVNGTDPLDAVYVGGNVGIGTIDPSSDLEISDLQARLALSSTKDGSWLSGSYMSEIIFRSEDTSGAAGASTRASIRTEPVDVGGSLISDGSNVQLVFKIKGDVAGHPPDAMILKSNKDLEVLGGIYAAERTGTANKSAFFDADGKLVEGDLVSGGQSVTCKIETTSSQTISSSGSPFVVFDSETIDNGSLSSDLTNNKITINEDGLYMVLFYMKLKGGNGAEFSVEIDVNGSAKEDHYQTLDSDDLMTVSGSYVGSFSNGDDVKIQISQVTVDSGQAVETIYSGSSLTVIRL